MQMNQIATLLNTVITEVIGEGALVSEDLSNIVDIGTAVFNSNAFDAYVKSLVNHIGKVIFVDRPYSGAAPSVLIDGWEYGSVLEKISSKMPTAVENPTWNLVDGQSYDPNVFTKPSATAKFYNRRTTFEIDSSITERQVKQSFSNAVQMNGFLSMLQNEVDKALTIAVESLIMRTINNMTAETLIASPQKADLTAGTSARAVNLLYQYNQQFGKTLTASEAMTEPAFIRYASFQIGLFSDRLTRMSTLFNIGGEQRFTPYDYQKLVFLSEFRRAADAYLQSDVFHDAFTKLIDGDVVPFWQSSGTGYTLAESSAIKVLPSSQGGEGSALSASGILCVIFDRDALGVANLDRRVTTQWNAKAEFTNYFYKQDAGYFNDLNENFIVFYAA